MNESNTPKISNAESIKLKAAAEARDEALFSEWLDTCPAFSTAPVEEVRQAFRAGLEAAARETLLQLAADHADTAKLLTLLKERGFEVGLNADGTPNVKRLLTQDGGFDRRLRNLVALLFAQLRHQGQDPVSLQTWEKEAQDMGFDTRHWRSEDGKAVVNLDALAKVDLPPVMKGVPTQQPVVGLVLPSDARGKVSLNPAREEIGVALANTRGVPKVAFEANPATSPKVHTLRCTFRPQVWVGDISFEVEPSGETQWTCEVDTLPKENDYESDALREHANAPQWVREWSGPFEVDYEVVSGPVS